MSAQPIEAQVLAVLRDLSPVRQAEILDFALFLRERERERRPSPTSSPSLEQDELATERDVLADDPIARFIGAFDSGGIPWAEEHDRYLGEALLREMQGGDEDDDAD